MKIDKKKFSVVITKGSGAGGQHRNKVETCVTITHLPTGMKETCQETRHKNKNIELAYERLLKKIEDQKSEQKHIQRNDKRVKTIEDAGIIRTYNFPRNEVKDHRTGKTANLKKVLNGDLDLLN